VPEFIELKKLAAKESRF